MMSVPGRPFYGQPPRDAALLRGVLGRASYGKPPPDAAPPQRGGMFGRVLRGAAQGARQLFTPDNMQVIGHTLQELGGQQGALDDFLVRRSVLRRQERENEEHEQQRNALEKAIASMTPEEQSLARMNPQAFVQNFLRNSQWQGGPGFTHTWRARPDGSVETGGELPVRSTANSGGDSWIGEVYTPETIDPLAYAVAMGAPVSAVTGGRNSHVSGLVNRRAAEIRNELHMDPRLFGVVQAAYRGNTRALNDLQRLRAIMVSAEQGALDGFQRARVLLRRLPQTEIPALNQAIRSGMRHFTGSPDAVAFFNVMTESADEMAKVLSGATGAGGITEGAREQALELFYEGFTDEQFDHAVIEARNMMHARVRGWETMIQSTSDAMVAGQPYADPDEEDYFDGGEPESPPGMIDMPGEEDRADSSQTRGPYRDGYRGGDFEEEEGDEEPTLAEQLAEARYERERRRRMSGR